MDSRRTVRWTAGADFAVALPFAFFAGVVAILFFVRPLGRKTGALAVAFGVFFLWWSSIEPSNDRDWSLEVARPPTGEIRGDTLVLHNVRDFDYRSEQDFTAHYEQRTYDLNALESMDLVLSYWGANRGIAHLILSIGFAGGDHVAVSVETRPEKGESYSVLGSLFKQFEVIYILAEERDVLQLRTNFRKERVYLYPTRLRSTVSGGRRRQARPKPSKPSIKPGAT